MGRLKLACLSRKKLFISPISGYKLEKAPEVPFRSQPKITLHHTHVLVCREFCGKKTRVLL
jgi:hypothetical protein